MIKLKIIRKILVTLVMLLPLLAGNSCKDDKCGCYKGDVQDANILVALNTSDIHYTDNGTSASFIQGYSIYHFCNPVAMYETYKEIVDNNYPLIELRGDTYWNCNYVFRRSSNSYYQYYNYTVEYDIMVTSMIPILDGK